MKNILADFTEKLEREDIFKPTTGNENLPQDSHDKSVRIVNCRIKNLVVKSTMSPHLNVHKCT